MANHFSQNDIEILDKTTKIRDKLISKFDAALDSEADATSDLKKVKALLELLDSADRQILAKAKLQVEDDSNKANEEWVRHTSDLITELHRMRASGSPSQGGGDVLPEIPETELRPVKPGQLIVGADNVTYKEFMESVEQENELRDDE